MVSAAAVSTGGSSATGGGGHSLPKVVLWDIDGTLVESTRLGFEGTNVVLLKNGYAEITEAQYKEGTKYPTPERFAFHVSGNTEDPAGSGLGQQFDELYVTKVSLETVPLFPGMADLLAELRDAGCRIGALSNACGEYVRAVLATHGLEGDFECQLGADEVPAGKPAPDGLLQCCAAMAVSPQDCIYIGDAPTDGQAASTAGMRGIGVSWGSHDLEGLYKAFPEVVSSTQALRSAILAKSSSGSGGDP